MNYPSITEIARGSGNSSISSIIEVLNESNEALQDIPWIPCNSGQTHITTIRTGLPTPSWRMLNAGVPKDGSTRKQIKASCGMLEAYSEIDAKEVELAKVGTNGQEGAANFLAQENAAWIEGFGQEASRVMFYGDTSKPQEPVGFVNYYDKCNGTDKTKSSFNCISGGGAGPDNTSVWFITWGPTTIHGIYPKASTAGFKEQFLGEHTVKDPDGNQFQALRTHYTWDMGFCVRDWRAAVRICNIDMSNLANAVNAESDPAADLLKLFTKAYYKLQYRKYSGQTTGRTVIYARPEILEALDNQTLAKVGGAHGFLSYSDVQGRQVLNFRGIPIRVQESLLDNETAVPSAS
jgi:hypothetical protein